MAIITTPATARGVYCGRLASRERVCSLSVMVLSAGRDGKWERFRVGESVERVGQREETKRVIWRDGWKKVSGQ